MRFFIDTTQSMSQSVLIKNKDNSFSCFNNGANWDFQVKIEPFAVLIFNISSNSKQCIGIEGCVKLSKKITLKKIEVTNVITGRLYIDDENIKYLSSGMLFIILSHNIFLALTTSSFGSFNASYGISYDKYIE